MEQIDGNSEIDEDWDKIYGPYDDDIEDYLRTGTLKSSDKRLWEYLLYFLRDRDDVVIALEAYKKAIEKDHGTGSYLKFVPWKFDPDRRNW